MNWDSRSCSHRSEFKQQSGQKAIVALSRHNCDNHPRPTFAAFLESPFSTAMAQLLFSLCLPFARKTAFNPSLSLLLEYFSRMLQFGVRM